MNHFEYHGSTIYDDRRGILEAAKFGGDGYKVVRHEKYADGSFVQSAFEPAWTFLHAGKLHHFSTTHHGQIESFFELNMSKDKCLTGPFGVYFEALPA